MTGRCRCGDKKVEHVPLPPQSMFYGKTMICWECVRRSTLGEKLCFGYRPSKPRRTRG